MGDISRLVLGRRVGGQMRSLVEHCSGFGHGICLVCKRRDGGDVRGIEKQFSRLGHGSRLILKGRKVPQASSIHKYLFGVGRAFGALRKKRKIGDTVPRDVNGRHCSVEYVTNETGWCGCISGE